MTATLPERLQALRAQAGGLEVQAHALVLACEALLGDVQDAEERPAECPRCYADEHQAAAGNVVVCGQCGANHRDGEVVDG